jgi:hypothetical protein
MKSISYSGVISLRRAALLCSLVSFSILVTAQPDSINDILQARGEIYFSFRVPGNIPLKEISTKISITSLRNDSVFAFANKKQFESFKLLNISFKLLNPLPDLISWNTKLKTGEIPASYPDYESYVRIMEKFAEQYPALCKLYDIGTTINGHKLLVLKISDNANEEETEPAVFYTSTMHGNETAGFVLLLRLADTLLSSYSGSSGIKKLVDNLEIYINPLANPDGTYFGGDSTVLQATRYNANHLDLNRNFPDPEYGLHPDEEEWQPETKAMMDFMKSHPVDLSVNFHTGAEVVNYPWDSWPRDHADNDWYVALSREYADTAIACGTNYFSSPMFDRGIIKGYDWYSISGGRQDYVNYYLHGREVTIELYNNFIPDPALLSQLWKYNKRSLLHYMENALYGVSGIITDSVTRQPVRAMISIPGHDRDSSEVYSRKDFGDYYRLLPEGSYTFEISANGYQTKTLSDIEVKKNSNSRLNVSLSPVRTNIQTFKVGNFYKTGPNPFRNYIQITKLKETNVKSINLYTPNGIKIKEFDHPGIIYTGDLGPGIYLLEINDEAGLHSFSLIKDQ